MQLTQDELLELTQYLISVLKRKRFSVKTTRYGTILFIEKFDIRCCPAILNSTEDGKQGYAYIQLVVNPYSEKDLGSYYKPRTNKSSHKLFNTNSCVDKYAGKDVHIDMHNYKQVIETFASDLNKDYLKIVSKREDIHLDAIENPGICIWKPNFRVWNISKDNISLKDYLFPYIKLDSSVYTQDIVMARGWLVVIKDLEDNGRFLMVALGNDDEYIPQSYHHIGYIYPPASDEAIHTIKEWMAENDKQAIIQESLVKIKDTGTVFDGMTGTIEQEDGNKFVVLVDFNSEHKVRNKFKKEQVEILED